MTLVRWADSRLVSWRAHGKVVHTTFGDRCHWTWSSERHIRLVNSNYYSFDMLHCDLSVYLHCRNKSRCLNGKTTPQFQCLSPRLDWKFQVGTFKIFNNCKQSESCIPQGWVLGCHIISVFQTFSLSVDLSLLHKNIIPRRTCQFQSCHKTVHAWRILTLVSTRVWRLSILQQTSFYISRSVLKRLCSGKS